MEDTIALYPATVHTNSAIEFAKLFVRHFPAVTITVVIIPLPSETSTDGRYAYFESISAAVPSITFLRLPPAEAASGSGGGGGRRSFNPAEFFQLPTNQNSNLRDLLSDLARSKRIKALVLDFFCNSAVRVAGELGIKCYFYFTNSLAGLALFLYFPEIDESSTVSIKDSDSPVPLPGLPSIPPGDIPMIMADRSCEAYPHVIDTGYSMRGSAGIIVNSFDALETNVLRAIVDGRCTPGSPPPPIYSVGPIVKETSSAASKHMCLTWLDSQPKGSVVFLCFGRDGVFSEAQLAEMAKGLERSGTRFLWVVRDPERTRPTMDLDSILPSGFLDRTKDRGLVVERWAPQSEVLSHGSVGGFVTHCGWNSILESLCVGVPMIGWPLYAEQKMTKHSLVHEIGVVLELKMDEPRDGVIVSADELANRVVELMTDSERGKAVRDRVTAMKEAAAAAMSVNGSSHVAVTKLVESFKQG